MSIRKHIVAPPEDVPLLGQAIKMTTAMTDLLGLVDTRLRGLICNILRTPCVSEEEPNDLTASVDRFSERLAEALEDHWLHCDHWLASQPEKGGPSDN